MAPIVRNWSRSDIFVVPSRLLTDLSTESGAVVRIPSRVLVEVPSYRIVAFGEDAREVEHAGFGRSRVIWPFSSTNIEDEVGAQVFLRSIFRSVLGSRFLLKPRVVMSLPSATSPFMRELWQHVLYAAGAREVVTVHPLLAIALGSGLPIDQPHGYAVASVSDDGLSIGLIAFGHVQYEKQAAWEAIPDSVPELIRIFSQVWQEMLTSVPVEFLAALQSEGCVVAIEEGETELAQQLSTALGSPIVAVPRTVEVLGLPLAVQQQEAK